MARAKPANGSRAAIALTCWLLSSLGVMMSVMMVVALAIAQLFTKPLADVVQSRTLYLGIGTAYAWTALAVMTGGWVGNRPVAWHWPVLGALVGILSAAYFAWMIPLYLPCVFLGGYLCYFHLAGYVPDDSEAAGPHPR